MGSIVCIDTDVLIWGTKANTGSEQSEKCLNAKYFFESLHKDHKTVIVPMVVLAEFLVKIPQSEHSKIMGYFEKSFIIVPIDGLTASVYAQIYQKNKISTSELSKPRQAIKIDRLIVASAVAYKADILYSEDNDIPNFAKGFIPVQKIPNVPHQLSAL